MLRKILIPGKKKDAKKDILIPGEEFREKHFNTC
jgi:hypothetical protein